MIIMPKLSRLTSAASAIFLKDGGYFKKRTQIGYDFFICVMEQTFIHFGTGHLRGER